MSNEHKVYKVADMSAPTGYVSYEDVFIYDEAEEALARDCDNPIDVGYIPSFWEVGEWIPQVSRSSDVSRRCGKNRRKK